MMVGMSSYAFEWNEQTVADLKNSGISAAEVVLTAQNAERFEWDRVRQLSAQHGIYLWSCHLPFEPFEEFDLSSTDETVRTQTECRFADMIRQGAAVGIDKFVVHPSAEPIGEYERKTRLACAVRSLSSLAETAARNGACIAVENLPRTCLGNTTEEMAQLVAQTPLLRICLDTNHLLTEQPADFVRALGEKIVTLHVSDCDFTNERHWLPGEGKVDWPSLITALQAVGYTGAWLYELRLQAPPTILRAHDLTFADIAENASALFASREPRVKGKAIT